MEKWPCCRAVRNCSFRFDTNNIGTNIYPLMISKENQYLNAFSGYFITNTDMISIYWSFFDTITNKWFETKQFRTGLLCSKVCGGGFIENIEFYMG